MNKDRPSGWGTPKDTPWYLKLTVVIVAVVAVVGVFLIVAPLLFLLGIGW